MFRKFRCYGHFNAILKSGSRNLSKVWERRYFSCEKFHHKLIWEFGDWYERLRVTLQFSCAHSRQIFIQFLPKIDKSKGLLFPWLVIFWTHSPFLKSSSFSQTVGTSCNNAWISCSSSSAKINKTNWCLFH